MGLLKTVFEVNLGLFGKKTADGYAFPHLYFNCSSLYTLAQTGALFFYSSSGTILASHL